MAKIQIKSEKLTPFDVFFLIMAQFDSDLSSAIDSTLLYEVPHYGYQYNDLPLTICCP